MRTIEFFVPGHPKAQPRPRAFARKFGDKWQARVFDAGTAEGWKSCIAQASKDIVWDRTESPVGIKATFIMPRPNSHFGKRKGVPYLKEGSPHWHTIKPDSDNLEKAVLDALSQLGAWKDDSQVCNKHIMKIYGDTPGMEISITY